MMNSDSDMHEQCIPLLLDRIGNLANVWSTIGMTLLGYHLLHKDYNYKRCMIASFVDKCLNGTEVNVANVLQYHVVFKADKPESLEDNIDDVPRSCMVDLDNNNATGLDKMMFSGHARLT